MSDLISRQEVIKAMESNSFMVEVFGTKRKMIDGMAFCCDIAELPTVEAKPVVHCKDCEHWGTGVAGETEHVKCCEYGKYMVGEMGYCCYADMRGGKHE